MEKKDSFVTRFAEALVKNSIMKEVEADSFVKEFHDRVKGNVVSFLLGDGILEREDVLKVLGTVYNVPPFDVKGHFFKHQWLLFFPKEFLLKKAFIPLEVDDDIMTIVISNPEDEETLDTLGNYVSYNVNVYVGIQEDILKAIKEYYDEDVITAETEEELEDSDNEDDDSDMVDFL